MKYEVELYRDIHDYQYRTVVVEADNPVEAEMKAFDASCKDTFWDSAKTEYGDTGQVHVESVTELA